MNMKAFAAEIRLLPEALDFIDSELAVCNVDSRTRNLIKVACEEVLANVMSYAYKETEKGGEVEITCGYSTSCDKFDICIKDSGVAYNPLEKSPPNLDADIDERQVGGLGIYMYKTIMDEVNYKYEDGCNVLQLSKNMNIGKGDAADEQK